MTKTIGIIGVGHFAAYLVEGFINASPDQSIILSPRGKKISDGLAKQFNCGIATDNQDVINKSDIIILSVKPNDLMDVLKGVDFPANKLVISVVAGAHYKQVTSLVAPASAVCALPISCAAINKSPTLLYPEHNEAKKALSLLGTVITCASQQEFNTAGTYSAFYGWQFKFMEEISQWGVKNDLPAEMARDIVEQISAGAAGMAAKDVDKTLEEIVSGVATKGGITELGLDIIDSQNSFKSWHDAMDAVRTRLSAK
ncbi:MAG: NAD(P)-binding domain-containing protein [Emcibacteraceae bacterium]|nr:NAD(P)-binding domain-containing protein [Emcibacteraceae bacterium]MDG1997000.1 NAD(P)-binding domain-containing protein [Emcibacteraceae bacterium]